MDKYLIARIKDNNADHVHVETEHHNLEREEVAACILSLSEDFCENYNDLRNLLTGIEQMVTRKLVIDGTNKIMENIEKL